MDSTGPMVEDVLTFWFGEPAVDGPALMGKIHRWFRSGAIMDRPIRERFGPLVVRAVAGELDGWKTTLRGRLALSILLDQMTRHVFRGTARMYAGDAAALAIARETVTAGLHTRVPLEERLFLIMPIVRAEDVEMQKLSVALTRCFVEESPAPFRAAWESGYQRALYYRSIIERFGRFPTRNAVLGRVPTEEELRFLVDEADTAPSLPVRAHGYGGS